MISNQHPTYMQLSKQGPNVIIRFNDLTHYPTYYKELEVRCKITKLIRTYLKYIHYILLNDTIYECIFPNIKYHQRTIFESCYTVNHNSQNLDTGYNLSSCRMPLDCHLICLNQTSKS